MKIKRTSIFKRDFKKLVKKHYDVTRFEKVAQDLFDYDIEALSRKYRDHALKGEWHGYRELHIQADWLLIYQLNNDELTLTLTRTGSHDDLF